MTKIQCFIVALIAVVVVMAAIFIYRVFFFFNAAKVEAYAKEEADKTGDPNNAYKLLIEGCEHIAKSMDLTAQIKTLAVIDKIEVERALVNTALNNLYSSGMIEKPTPVIPSAPAAPTV